MKSYTWEEVKKFLEMELRNKKHFLTFGTIGSCNIEHDIDVLITKKPRSPSRLFYKDIHNLFESLDEWLTRKYSSRAIRLQGLNFQGELLNFIETSKNDLVFHSLIYVSLPQIKNEWRPWSSKKESVVKLLENEYNCMLGKNSYLFSKDFDKEGDYDHMFTFLTHYDRLNIIYPEKKLIKFMNDCYYYLFEKRLGLKAPKGKTKAEIKQIFYQLCDELDKLEGRKK